MYICIYIYVYIDENLSTFPYGDIGQILYRPEYLIYLVVLAVPFSHNRPRSRLYSLLGRQYGDYFFATYLPILLIFPTLHWDPKGRSLILSCQMLISQYHF